MAEILETICKLLGVIKKYVIDPLIVQSSYLCCSNSILESLKAEVERLEITSATLQLDIDATERNLERIGPDVVEWLKRVDKIKEETNRIFEAIPKVQQGCVKGSCPNLKLRYSVSRDAKKLTKDVVEIRVNGKFDRVGHPASPPRIETIPVVSGTEFESRKTIEEEIMAALRDDRVYLIGICGMGGVGKTTMVKKIGKRASEENLFDAVDMAVVSQQPDRSGIQQEIAEALGLKLEEKTIPTRARKIHTRLMDLKKILIIIDDIWERLNLEELGIPSQSNHKGCKIILTSRDRHVCTVMKATKIFSLEGLLEKEAWALFKDNAGVCVDDCELHQIAKDVVSECKGLPLALVNVGRALRDRNAKPIWEDALVQLQRSAPSSIPEVLKDVYQPLQLSYNHLDSDEARYLFFLCCLFPEDSRISLIDLLHYGVGLRIFSNVETLREARNRVYGLAEMLESRYMLIDDGACEGIKYVKMHDVIRDMAIHMTSHDPGLKDWPGKDSLILRGFISLPEFIPCPTLKLLRMEFEFYWDCLISNTFFNMTTELNVLDISGITSLPSSLQFLTNLRTLRLQESEMKTVSMIGQLAKLEILDLSDSSIEVLPEEIGRLENLKSLDLNRCSQLREIAPGVIASLKRLEELFVLHSFENWAPEVGGEGRRNANLEEVASLKNLTALQLHIPDPSVLPQATLHWPKLERFTICIGARATRADEEHDQNSLILGFNRATPLVHSLTRKAHYLELNLGGMAVSVEVIKLIEKETQHLKSLRLDGCGNIKYLANILFKEDIVFSILRSLSLSNCGDLEVICCGEPPLAESFNALKVLRLEGLCKLTHLWDQNLFLPNLSEIAILDCKSLQYVFLQSIDKCLSQLKSLEIKKCPALKEVFKVEREGSTDIVGPIIFPNLTSLWFEELPNLDSFCKAVSEIDFPLLRTLHIESSHNLKFFCPMEESSFVEQGEHNLDGGFLFHQKVTFASLVELKLRNLSTATKLFSSQIPIGSFSRLELLEVEFCCSLKVIFSPPAFRNFKTLSKLIVKNSPKLEEVVGKEDEASQAPVEEPLFVELKELILSELPNFKKFCHMTNDIELPHLESITIEDCHQMEKFSVGSLSLPRLTHVFGLLYPELATQILFKREVTFASLVEMKLYNIKTATKIFTCQVPIGSFGRLKLLEVESCPNLKVIFSPPAFRNFTTLCHLKVKNCSKLEEVVGKEDEKSQDAIKDSLFPELKELILSELPNFKTFCCMKNDIELPQLKSITIVDCHKLKTFSLGSLSLPHLTCIFGLLEPDIATRIFFKKETPRHEIHLKSDSFTLSAKELSSFEDKDWCLAKDTSDDFIVVARPFRLGNFRISGRFEMVKLLPGTLYEVLFEIKLEESDFHLDIKLELTQSEGITRERIENLRHKPIGEWIEILVGEFTTGPDPIGDLEFSLCDYFTVGLLIKGVTIRPKA